MAGNITNEALKSLMNSSNPMWVLHEDTLHITSVNQAFVQKFEYSLDEMLSIPFLDLVFHTDQRDFENALNENEDDGNMPRVWQLKSKLGRNIYVLINVIELTYNNSPIKLVTFFEVPEQFYKQEKNRGGIPLSDLLNIISHFDFENPRNNKNRTLLNHLKSAVRQLESIMYQEPAVN